MSEAVTRYFVPHLSLLLFFFIDKNIFMVISLYADSYKKSPHGNRILKNKQKTSQKK